MEAFCYTVMGALPPPTNLVINVLHNIANYLYWQSLFFSLVLIDDLDRSGVAELCKQTKTIYTSCPHLMVSMFFQKDIESVGDSSLIEVRQVIR